MAYRPKQPKTEVSMPAKVTVTNQIKGPTGKPLVVTLTAMDDPDTGIIQFQYAPNEISFSPQPSWTARTPAGAQYSRMDWTGNKPMKVDVNTVQSSPPGDARTETLLSAITALATRATSVTQMPSRVRLSWGIHTYQGVITSPVIDKDVVDDQGNALVATIKFSLMESL